VILYINSEKKKILCVIHPIFSLYFQYNSHVIFRMKIVYIDVMGFFKGKTISTATYQKLSKGCFFNHYTSTFDSIIRYKK